MTISPFYISAHACCISIQSFITLSLSIKIQCKLLVSKLGVQYSTCSLACNVEAFPVGKLDYAGLKPHTLPCSPRVTSFETENRCSSTCSTSKALNNVFKPRLYSSIIRCAARRRVRYDDDDDGDEDKENEEHHKEIALLELYSQSVRGEALIVHAMVDNQPVEVLIFKGFSSCLSYKTSPDPSKSILPARAVIESIDRVKGPFDPSNIEYLQKDLSWEVFKSNLPPNLQMYIS